MATYAVLSGKDIDLKNILNAAIAGATLSLLSLGALAQGPPNAPFAGQANMTCAKALSEAAKMDTDLAAMAKSFNADAAKLKKSPKDAKVKKAYVDNGTKYEQKIVHGANKLGPAIKYRAGLALCRLVLAVDSKNAPCAKDKSDIEGIYKQMGRPIPQ